MIKRFLVSLFTSLSIIALVAEPLSAASVQDFYSDNDVLFFDENFTPNCSPSSGSSATPVASSGQNVQTGYQYFVGKGFTPEQSAGIIGNLIHESGMDPNTRQNGGGPGRGLAQWEAGPNGRWVNLVQFARDQNRNEFDLMVQLDFIWFELQGSEKSAYEHLLETQTVEEATESFLDKYERAGDPALNARIDYARETLQQYGDLPGIGGSASSGGCGGSASGGTIVGIAEAEFAKNIVERPPRCDAGNPSTPGTCGPEIDKYTDTTLEYWCADFVSWVYKTAGTPFTGGASGGWRIASVRGVQAWFETNGLFFTRGDANNSPQPGDVVIYSYSHTDIIVAVQDGSIVTIGGNTGVGDVQNGSGVGKKTISMNNGNIVGYGRLQ